MQSQVDALHSHERQILRFLEDYITEHGVAPSFDEIREAVNIGSKDHIYRDLNLLEKKGFIQRQRGKSRSIRLLNCLDGQSFQIDTIEIPLCGDIAAGQPIAAPGSGLYHETDETITLTRDLLDERWDLFALRVKGNSMIDALIHDGDIVVMKHQNHAENGDMVAVWLIEEGETTLKRFYHEGNWIRLQPENQTMDSIYVMPENVEIQGKVVTVIRRLAA